MNESYKIGKTDMVGVELSPVDDYYEELSKRIKMKTKEQILKTACQEQVNSGHEIRFLGDTEREVPVSGITIFEQAVLMAMQGYCQFSTRMPGDMLIEMIAIASVNTAKATLIAIHRERELLFPKSENDTQDDLPF